jgi:hypothetical protein
MICPECGEYLAQQLIQGEARVLVHRWLRHQPPAVQVAATWALVVGALWLVSQLSARMR